MLGGSEALGLQSVQRIAVAPLHFRHVPSHALQFAGVVSGKNPELQIQELVEPDTKLASDLQAVH